MNPPVQRKRLSVRRIDKRGVILGFLGDRATSSPFGTAGPREDPGPTGGAPARHQPSRAPGVPGPGPGYSDGMRELFHRRLREDQPHPLLGVRPSPVHRLLLAARPHSGGPPLHELSHPKPGGPGRDLGGPFGLPHRFQWAGLAPRPWTSRSGPAFVTSFASAPARRAKPRATHRMGSSGGDPKPVGSARGTPASRARRAPVESNRWGPGPTSTAAPAARAHSVQRRRESSVPPSPRAR